MANRFSLPGGVSIPDESIANGVPLFATGQPRIGTRKILLDNANSAGAPLEIVMTGNVFWVIDASATGTLANVRFNDQTSESIPIGKGFALAPFSFNRIYLDNTAQAGAYIVILYAVIPNLTAALVNPLLSAGAVTLTGNVNGVVERPGTLADVADVAVANGVAGQVVAANTKNRRIILCNTGANPMRVGAAPAAATGALVQPNGSITLMGSYAVSAYGVGGATTCSVTLEQD